MARVVTDIGALTAATAASLQAVSMRKANVGAEGARRRSRRRTGAMAAGWHAEPEGINGARVTNPVPYTVHNEYGTRFMSAAPMARPSMPEAQAG